MKRGLLRTFRLKDQEAGQFQENVKVAVEALAADHDLLSVPVTSLSVTSVVTAGKSVVFYRGTGGASLMLPQAKSQGDNVSAILLIGNLATTAITLIAAIGDTVNGAASLSLSAGALAVLASDGISKWLRAS